MASWVDKKTDFARCDDRAMGYDDDDDDDDSEFLDDPLALSLQARPPAPAMPERPEHVSEETHNLVCATLAGGDAYKATREAEVEALRARRLRELKGGDRALVSTAVDARAMLDAVRDADPATPVLIHVFSDAVAACAAVDRALALLSARQAQRPTDCRFVGRAAPVVLRLDAAACVDSAAFGVEIDREELPALLVYRDRELVHHKLAASLDDADDVEDFLEDSGVVDAAT